MQLRFPRTQLTVDELTSHIQGLFVSDATLKSVVVIGETAEFKKHTSGHCYFTLMGKESRVVCALFKQYAGFVPQWPRNGDSVLVEGSVSVYPQRGVYQMYVRRIIPAGAGAVERARKELRERLEKEGLFASELKRLPPPYPRKVALITSETGAAVWDVIRVAGRRYPVCDIIVIPAQVQGAEAPSAITQALSRVALIPGLDCVLLVRGGGGREDLTAFDDEQVVRAVRSCPVPVVSGVGHDVDLTLCDMAADLRASTPSAAAELVFPDREDLEERLLKTRDRMAQCVRRRAELCRVRLDHVEMTLKSRMLRLLRSLESENRAAFSRLRASISLCFAEARNALSERIAALDALSPLAVLGRGFVTCERDGERVRSAFALAEGERISLRFSDGRVGALVSEAAASPVEKGPVKKIRGTPDKKKKIKEER